METLTKTQATQQGTLRVPPNAVQTRTEGSKVASQFEAMFLQQIVSKMRESSDISGESSMFGSGPGADTYSDWFDSFMSEHLASTGQVGVATAIMRHFEDLGQIEAADKPTDEPATDEPATEERATDEATTENKELDHGRESNIR